MITDSPLAELGISLLLFSIAPALVSLGARIRPIRALARRGPAARRAIVLACVLLSWALNLGLYAWLAWRWAKFTYAHPNLMEATCANQAGWTEKAIWTIFMVPRQLREIPCLDRVYLELSPTSPLVVMHPTTMLSLISILVVSTLTRRLYRARE